MKIIVDLPDWYIKQTKAIKHPDFVNEAIAKGKPLDDIDKEEIRAYFDGEAFGWDKGREALVEDLKAEIIKRDKNVKAVRSDNRCCFTTEEILRIIDTYMTESECDKC